MVFKLECRVKKRKKNVTDGENPQKKTKQHTHIHTQKKRLRNTQHPISLLCQLEDKSLEQEC